MLWSCILPSYVWLAVFSSTTALSRWPSGTVAQASSEALGNPPYNASFAIDGDQSTFWNDATLGDFPDVLTIAAPQLLNLSGIILVSNPGGWPTHYEVSSLSPNLSWAHLAELQDLTSYISTATFNQSVMSSQFRISVFNVSTAPCMPLHTRVNEVYPVYVNGTTTPSDTDPMVASTSNSTGRPAASKPSMPQKVDTTVILGAVAGSCVTLIIFSGITFRIQRRRRRGQAQVWDRFRHQRKELPTPTDTGQEMSNETFSRVEMGTRNEWPSIGELYGSRLPRAELAGSDILRAELPSATTAETEESESFGWRGNLSKGGLAQAHIV